jgi:2,3-bisphosphoglycerate-dependent phosphoglycerate mutase
VTTILLVRHGETEAERRVQGHSDTPLNETGRAQARALVDELAEEAIDAVYSSDLLRAYETARIVAQARGLDVTAIPDLRERHFGTWEGLTDDEIFARFPEARNGSWGDGESQEEMAQRVLDALRRIAETHVGERALVVSHGGPLRAVLSHCGAADMDTIDNCHVVRIEVEGGVIRAE